MSYDVVIVGAGLSGLTAAYRLSQVKDLSLLVLESEARGGGLMRTVQEAGYLVEAGPTTFPSTGRHIMGLCQSLGLRTTPVSSLAKYRYIFQWEDLHKAPSNPWTFLTTDLLSIPEKLYLLGEPFRRSPRSQQDETVASFVRRRLGNRVLENMVGPFLSGIYAGDPEKLSFPAVFPKLAQWEREDGSLIGGMMAQGKKRRHEQHKEASSQPYGLVSLDGGMEALPKAMMAKLPPESLRLGVRVTDVQQHGGLYELRLSTGEIVTTKCLILATPAGVSSQLLEPVSVVLSQHLGAIPYVPLTVVHLGFPQEAIAHPLNGFGFLAARSSKMPVLGCIWASSLFPGRAPKNHVLLSTFLGGAYHPDVSPLSEQAVIEKTTDGLKRAFHQLVLKPAFSKVCRYTHAIPQYNLGHLDRLAMIEAALNETPGLYLTGNYLHGISLDACVESGDQAAEAAGKFLASISRPPATVS